MLIKKWCEMIESFNTRISSFLKAAVNMYYESTLRVFMKRHWHVDYQ